ncbi:MAG: T9SS type A sorting domain-containing protein, partial [Gemmatimonadetes bacterium]|nr:T9SS type A sorting domain-containing protein [Gemmatimonadota bacterium]
MRLFIGSLIGLLLSVHVGAEPLLEGHVRLSSGQPAVGVQVRLFDLTDLRRFVGTNTDESGHFALPLRAFSTARGSILPTDFALGQNYPNPFNPSTIIPYQLSAAGHVRLEVFNLLGQRLATLVDAEQSAGAYTAQWDATDVAGRTVGAGVYIYRLSSGGMTESRRMVLVDGQAGIPAVGAMAQGSVWVVEGAVETDGSVYGLTVSGEGLVAYVDPAFRVGVDVADIVIEEYGGSPRMKIAADRILGDVNNDGQVDVSDVLYIALYSRNPSVILPNNGDIYLGDVNDDGRVDVADALLLVRYIIDPSDPALPPGIGQAAIDSYIGFADAVIPGLLYKMYWTEGGWDRWGADSLGTGSIQCANLDGSDLETLVSDLDTPWGIALDEDIPYGDLYWTNLGVNAPGTGSIRRANLDDSDLETLISDLSSYSYSIALDVSGDKMYWTYSSSSITDTGSIRRANLDGSNIETLISDLFHPYSIALDVSGDKMYWTELGADWFSGTGSIRRATLDGSDLETLVSDLSHPVSVVLDVGGGKMYWTDWDADSPGTGSIRRANLDG